VHLGHKVLVDIDFTIGIVLVNVLLKYGEAQHVAIFMVTIVLGVLLNGIIGEMNKRIVNVL